MKYSQGLYHNYCSCKCSSSSNEVQKKVKQTNLERYGCEYTSQNDEVKEKVKQTCLEKYGCENVFQNKEVREKVKQTNLERYNVENPFQSEKTKRSHHDKSFDYLIPKFIEQGIIPLFSKKEYDGYNKIYKWKCNKCGNEFESKIYPTHHNKACQYLPHCWNCYPKTTNSGISKKELELLDFVKKCYPNAHKDKKLIKPYELDIVIDELKLAVEFNGDYFHSIERWLEHNNNLDGYYGRHLNKVLEANKKGYRLIHIWESKLDEIENKLKDILEGKEDLNFAEDKLILDRSWYNNVEIPDYELIGELPPEIINRNGYNVENCGYLVYERYN